MRAAGSALGAFLALGALLGGCGGSTASAPGIDGGAADGAPSPAAGALGLSVEVRTGALAGLSFSSGDLELKNVALLGDVAANDRTTVALAQVAVPGRAGFTFPDAPYGLYSRVHASVDDVHLTGSWQGTPLSVSLEIQFISIDVRGPTLDYEPMQGAHFVLTADVSMWFDAATLDAATLDNGTITIDYLHNLDASTKLLLALQRGFTVDGGVE